MDGWREGGMEVRRKERKGVKREERKEKGVK